MNNKLFFGKNDLRYLYFRFKDSSLYSISIILATITICFMLIASIIIPLANNYFSLRSEVIAKREQIRVVNENIEFMKNLNKDELEDQLAIVTSAVPAQKDFGGIIDALSDSSAKSGASVNDYKFVIGEIASGSARKVGEKKTVSQTIDMTISLEGNTLKVRNFLKELSEKSPLVEVFEIDGSSEYTLVKLKFHYKPYPVITIKADEAIAAVSPKKREVIEKLSKWKSTPIFNVEDLPTSSSSAVPLF
ncbi:MAG TPA: hypothetical protein VM077_03755 [Candidatus Limnocylindrales bacterium]|nr:hypothetical protein [Candidatus Limnocylindrales bacterium]